MPYAETLRLSIEERDNAQWCLFLDRDGVINTRIVDGYVRSWDEFEFAPGTLDALAAVAAWAPRIVVVTNQQGVGKGLMTSEELDDVHARMTREISAAGGRIDAVLTCPHLASRACDCRKPSPGMPRRYLQAHPELDGALSIMVGDTESDMEMGRRLAALTGGALTVRIDDTVDPRADLTFPTLAEFARAVAAERTAGIHSAE